MKRLGGRRSSGDSSALLYHVQSQASGRLALLRGGLVTVGVVFVIPTYTGLQP
jgi:hypothetical protein